MLWMLSKYVCKGGKDELSKAMNSSDKLCLDFSSFNMSTFIVKGTGAAVMSDATRSLLEASWFLVQSGLVFLPISILVLLPDTKDTVSRANYK